MSRLILFLVFSLNGLTASANSDIWLLVDTKKLTLEVKKGEHSVYVFKNIAIGRAGAGNKKYRGDDVTPLGTYKISWINRNSGYRLFYGFDYPSVEDAERALSKGLIGKKDHDILTNAHQQRQVPPQTTPLGGMIGIHGLGRADPTVHSAMNWTHGCVALTNEQIDKLDRWVSKGTVVKIK